MHQNTFGSRAPPRPAGGAYVLPQTTWPQWGGPTSKGGRGEGLLVTRGSGRRGRKPTVKRDGREERPERGGGNNNNK